MNLFNDTDRDATQNALVSRRHLLIGAAASGAILAFARPSIGAPDPTKALAEKAFEPNIWCQINADGSVVVNVTRAEMGQHIGTALARILADELEVDWRSVRLNYVDSDPKWGVMFTGGSLSVWLSFPVLSQAGAAGRIAFVEEGARLLGYAPAACTARNGVVTTGSKSITYAEIVKRGNLTRSYSAEDLKAMPIKNPIDRRLVGFETGAIDIPSKTNGTAVYGIDAQVDGMVYARPKIPPTRNGSKVVSVDDSGAKSVRGYLRSLVLEDPSGTVPGWVMVIADSFPAANQAADKVKVVWQNDDTAGVTEQDVLEFGAKQIADRDGGSLVVDDVGVEAALAGADSILEQAYTTASALHFQMEPVNALAFQKNGVYEIHTGSQRQSLTLPWLAKALGVSADKIVLRTYLLGGGFGRRLNGDYAVPAALATKALGKPVKMVCTREDDSRFCSFRSPSVQRLRMAFDKSNNVIGMDHDASAGWPIQVMAPALLRPGVNGVPYDRSAIFGADHWYSVGSHRVRALSNELANRSFRPGWLRAVGPGWTCWAVESFIDEAAHKIGADPLGFRLALLDGKGRNAGDPPRAVGGALRQAAVLRRAADKAGWSKAMPKDTGLGIATTFGQERVMATWTACAARVKVDRATGGVTLEKLTLVVDAGTIIHPDGALAQIEGGALWGASLALHEGTEFEKGQVRDINLDTYTPMRMSDVPELDIELVNSTQAPVGLGEPATTVVGPAIANAIFAAAGIRLRHLPIRPAAVLKALRQAT